MSKDALMSRETSSTTGRGLCPLVGGQTQVAGDQNALQFPVATAPLNTISASPPSFYSSSSTLITCTMLVLASLSVSHLCPSGR